MLLLLPAKLLVAQPPTQSKVVLASPIGIIASYWESLPNDYAANPTKNYPLLVYMHGLSERQFGATEELDRLIMTVNVSGHFSIAPLNCPPDQINKGIWPSSFTVNGTEVKPIVIAAQYKERASPVTPTPAEFDQFLTYLFGKYRVDERMVYLTGTSSGGPIAINYTGDNSVYAKKVAGIAAVSATSSSNPPSQARINVIAGANIPVRAYYNQDDPNNNPTYGVQAYANTYVNGINSYIPTPVPAAVAIQNPPSVSSGHNAWGIVYRQDYNVDEIRLDGPTENNTNLWEWLFSFQRNDDGGIIPLPVTWNHFEARLYEGSVLLSWSTIMERENALFTVERQDEAKQFVRVGEVPGSGTSTLVHQYQFTDHNPPSGILQYRIRQTDINGTVSYSKTIRVAERPAGNQPLLLFPNPQAAGRAVTLEMTDWRNKQVTIGFYDNQGRLVLTQKATLNGGGRLSLAPALAPGLYQVSIQQGGVRRLSTLVLQ